MASPSFQRLGSSAAGGAGCFDRAEAHAANFSDAMIRRRVRVGAWDEFLPGVFRAAESPMTRLLREHGALKWLAPHSFISHGSAASYYGFAAPPLRIWCSAPVGLRVLPPPWIALVRTRHPSYLTRSDGLRIASPNRAMADLGMVHDRRELAASLATGVQSGRLSVDEVREQTKLLSGRPGTADMFAVLAEFEPAFESILGREMFELFDVAGIRGVEPGVQVRFAEGGYAILDGAIKSLRLGFEADGFAAHGSKAQQAADKARDIRLGLELWRVDRFPTDQIRRNRAETLRLLPQIVTARAREIGASPPR